MSTKILGVALIIVVIAAISVWTYRPGADVSSIREQGGGIGHAFTDRRAFDRPVTGLSEEQGKAFRVGDSFFDTRWVIAPASTIVHDGLGPLFNARSCFACHENGGRGSPPQQDGEDAVALLFRLSLPKQPSEIGGKEKNIIFETMDDPVYGGQLQRRGILGVPGEARVRVRYEERAGTYADGEDFSLRVPHYEFENLQYGELNKHLLISPRIAPAMIGLGLLDAIAEEDILRYADAEDCNADGISGRANYVQDVLTGELVIGRFGWKANQPSVKQQVAAAFQGDIGLTTSIFMNHNHTIHQKEAVVQPNGGEPEVLPRVLEGVTVYCSSLAVPQRRNIVDPAVIYGSQLFESLDCTRCHRTTYQTGAYPQIPQLGGKTIHPYTDMLLHDMGTGLADGRPDGEAGTHEWRTAPLWGLGLIEKVNGHMNLLHDGRARGLAEAILWHGGEAAGSRDAFKKLKRADREALLAYLRSL